MPQCSVSMGAQSSSVTLECDCLAHRFANAADNGFRQSRYPTDMTDAEWAAVRPLLPVPGWMRGRGGQPEAYCHRAILDAIRYLVDNGIKWRAMPADFPPWDRVYAFFRRWRDHGLVKEFHDRLRARIRERLGRDAEPSAGVIDSQSVKADAVVGSDSRGFDGGKLINGLEAEHRHRHHRAPACRVGHRGECAGLRRRHQTPGPGRGRTPRHPQGVGRRRPPSAPRPARGHPRR
ncbi:transposase [Streptomyces sp. LBL]|nr:transposase [Streptomyces sp. LBL]